jgi:hypothetical protein
MSVDPKQLAAYFSLARPSATKEVALEYAASQFPESAYRVSRFLAEWLRLRDPLAAGVDETTARSSDGAAP